MTSWACCKSHSKEAPIPCNGLSMDITAYPAMRWLWLALRIPEHTFTNVCYSIKRSPVALHMLPDIKLNETGKQVSFGSC